MLIAIWKDICTNQTGVSNVTGLKRWHGHQKCITFNTEIELVYVGF